MVIVLFPTPTKRCLHCFQCRVVATPTHAATIHATAQNHIFFFQHPFLTLPDVTLYLRKALGNSHRFVKPSQCFACWFLKFISRGYPLFLTFVNNISMNTTKCSFQCLLFELCKLWWCLTNWLLDKKVDILCSDRVI